MRALGGQVSNASARGAWVSVGAPILGLVVVIIAFAVAAFAGFARQHDRAFAESSQRLADGAVHARGESLAAMLIEYANWDAAFANISAHWNAAWVRENIYSSVADAMFVFRADGEVRFAWFNRGVADQAEVEAAAIEAASAIPRLAALARARGPSDTAAVTHAKIHGRWAAIAVAPVTVENDTARIRRAGEGGHDFIVAVDLVNADELAGMGRTFDLQGLAFAPAETEHAANVSMSLRAADDTPVGVLEWRHARPGAAAFARQIWLVVLGLLGVGVLTALIARRLVAAHIEASAKARAALEASQDKSEFLARVTSELRTPLNAVIGYAELIQEEAATPVARDDAQRIISAARELSGMLSDILDQSRIDGGAVRLKLEVVPVAGMLAEVQGLMHPVARAAGIEVIVSQEAVAVYAYADHARLRQCLMNLVGNAVKFSQRGGVVRLRAGLRHDRIVIEVSDSGLGIAPEEMPVIFRPFGQANAAIGAVYGGAGLGLSIAHALAREMGGDISVISTQGEGSVFYLSVPTASARALTAA